MKNTKKGVKVDSNSPLKRSSLATFQFDPASPAKNLKNIFTHQNIVIDRLFSERDDLIERVQALEERLSNSLSMIAVQKSRIMNLSDLSARLSAVAPIEQKHQSLVASQITANDKIIVEQLLKINPDQIPLYLAHNPFPIQCTTTPSQMGGERMNAILSSLPPNIAVSFASAAFAQIFRSSDISELVQTLRKSIHNRQFVHKIEAFCCKLFKASFCQLFTLQPQQNQLVTLFDNDGFTLQVPVGKGIVGNCAKDGKVIILQSTQESHLYDPEIDDFFNIGANPSLLIPIFDSSSNFVISVLLVHSPKVGALFTPEDLNLGEILSTQISPFLTAYVEHMEKSEDRNFRNELSHAVKTLLGKNTLDELLPTTLSVVQRAIQADDAELFLYDKDQGRLFVFEPQVAHNGTQFFARRYFSAKSGIPYHVISILGVVNITRLVPDKCEYFSRETDIAAIGRPYLAVPIFAVDQQPIAVLAAYGRSGSNFFSPLDAAALQQIAVQVGVNLTNVFAAQQMQEIQHDEERDSGSFERPLRALQQQILKGSDRTMTNVCEAVAKECVKRINCDLLGIWEVSPSKITQKYILKSENPFAQVVDIPPVVAQVAKSGQVAQSSVASEVRNMIGSFDDEVNYRSYSNLTVPAANTNGDIKWVIMAENSMTPQGRFVDSDTTGLEQFAMFLLLATESHSLQLQLANNGNSMTIIHKLASKLTPIKADLINRMMDELKDSLSVDHYALYSIDTLNDTLLLVVSDCEEAPKAVPLSQGLLGKVSTSGDNLISNDIYNTVDFNQTTDAFGLDEVNSGLFIKLSNEFMVQLLSNDKDKFVQSDVQSVIEASYFIETAFEVSRNFNDLANSGTQGISAEQRAMFMSRSSSPTRSDLEEFSDRFFNIMNYGDDERVIMLLKMFVSQGVIRKLQVPFQKLVQFICALRSNYNDTPYHNWTHACDVAQFVFSCIMRGRLRLYLQDLELFALLLAAISHDVDHHGLNNAFHKKARSPLGILYEDRPVMEMHHSATAIKLLEKPEHNVLEGIESPAERSHFYEFFIKIILATDMDKHFAYIKEFEEMMSDFDKRNERHRLLLAQIVMKCGDVSNTTRAFDVASDMAHKLTEEFFKQGDIEQQLGLEITPMCDRSKASHISTSQVGFYGFLASPLLTALGNFIQALQDNSEQLEKNKRNWEQQKLQWEASQSQK